MKSSWVMSAPVINTAHLPNEHALRDVFNLCSLVDIHSGWLVYISDVDVDVLEEDLAWIVAIVRWMRAEYGEEHDWLRFDSDGDLITELPTWEW